MGLLPLLVLVALVRAETLIIPTDDKSLESGEPAASEEEEFVVPNSLSPLADESLVLSRPDPVDACGAWGEWKNMTCWWPSDSWEELPEECSFVPIQSQWPSFFKKFVESKEKERYARIAAEFAKRGSPPRCGHCARSFKCRARNSTESTPQGCRQKEVEAVDEQCLGTDACEVNLEEEACPSPLFLSSEKIERLIGLVKKGDHKSLAMDLFKSRLHEGKALAGRTQHSRSKRHSSFQGPHVDYGNYIFDDFEEGRRQLDKDQLADRERSWRRWGEGKVWELGPKDEEKQEERLFNPQEDIRGREHSEKRPFDRRGEDQRRRSESDEEEKMGGRPKLWGPRGGPHKEASEEHERREGWRSNERNGKGPRGEDRRRGWEDSRHEERSRGSSERSSSNSREHEEPRKAEKHGPHGNGKYDRNKQEQHKEDRPWSSESHEHKEHHRGDEHSQGSSERQHGGRGDSSEEEDISRYSKETEDRRPWRPKGRGGQVHSEELGMGPTGEMTNFEDEEEFDAYHVEHLHQLLHGTSCASTNSKCLCCCGPFIPDVEDGSCKDIRELIPGIESTLANLTASTVLAPFSLVEF